MLGIEPNDEANLEECAGLPGCGDDPPRIGGVCAEGLLHEDRDAQREGIEDVTGVQMFRGDDEKRVETRHVQELVEIRERG